MPWHNELVWLPEYSVGNNRLDPQHKRLYWLFHAAAHYLGSACHDQTERYLDFLRDLEIYAREHFATEENILEYIQYPEIAEHRAEHRAYLLKLLNFAEDTRARHLRSGKLLQWINNWWLGHSLGTDKQFSAYLTSKTH